MTEVLGYSNIVDDDGNVRVDPEAIQGTFFVSSRNNGRQLAIDHPSFAFSVLQFENVSNQPIGDVIVAKNKRLHLLSAIEWIGRSNRAQGAAMSREDIDRVSFGGIADVHAEHFTQKAQEEISRACGACAVHALCSIVGGLLHGRLEKDATARRRLKNRTVADGEKGLADDITCERYMAPKRVTQHDHSRSSSC